MRFLAITVVLIGCLIGTGGASAQRPVRPQWNYAGSAVCPNGYDYFEGWCRARVNGPGPGYGGPRYYDRGPGGYYDAVPPRWNRLGSAVCPDGYDYHAYSGLCRPQRY